MTLWFSVGTARELIKLFPLLVRAERAGTRWAVAFTGQSPVACTVEWKAFGLPSTRWHPLLYRAADLGRASDAASWFAQAMVLSKHALLENLTQNGFDPPSPGSRWVVHGETLSTVLGAIYGSRFSATVAHVETGPSSAGPFLRRNLHDMNRQLVAKIACLHFAPTDESVRRLERAHAPGRVLSTNGDTHFDAVDAALELPFPEDIPQEKFTLVDIRHPETLAIDDCKRDVKETLLSASEHRKLVLVSDEPTLRWARSEPDIWRTLETNGARWIERTPFAKFTHWMARSELVVADDDGAVCEYLGIPSLLLRHRTERPKDQARKCRPSSADREARSRFLAHPEDFRDERRQIERSAANGIWEVLAENVAG